MQKSSVYHVWIESVAGDSRWSGTFSEVPFISDLLEAIDLDILDLNPTVEHEDDRISEYRRLQAVVEIVKEVQIYDMDVTVADTKIGEIRMAEEKIFVIQFLDFHESCGILE